MSIILVAIAGALVLFFIGLELVLGLKFFAMRKQRYHNRSGSFPSYCRAGSMTTLISLKTEYDIWEILIALTLNMIFVYFVLRATDFFARFLGEAGIQILKRLLELFCLPWQFVCFYQIQELNFRQVLKLQYIPMVLQAEIPVREDME